MSPVTVAIVGATGETGRSIVDALLQSPTDFGITALSRPSSMEKPENQKLREGGINVVAYDVHGPLEKLVDILTGVDVVISAVSYAGISDQIPLARAAKEAGVKRFVPSAYAPTTAPNGAVEMRDRDVFNYIKELHLPYTFIDVGWWYQGFIPRLPSGRTEYARFPNPFGDNPVMGDGNVIIALADLRDAGRYIARIIVDPRTLNKMVYAYTETMTANQIFDQAERNSEESVERQYVSETKLHAMIAEAQEVVKNKGASPVDILKLHMAQYQYSIGIKDQSSPEYADYLGYLSSKDLYPDFKAISFSDFMKDALDGKLRPLYS
ncbi:hypothetical protein BDV28DRAFT_165037 [Aspergillus coremiiformis]|uniref:NmrA-like domain-containing protein n=1 Tax=Aspergillus coremiiformis TaxID=138285 RepID=A0A5N6ZFI1_9EURO|nr:hypothetical protein BDV28DRAFT_165037 [Aspergillus coremiiformis]